MKLGHHIGIPGDGEVHDIVPVLPFDLPAVKTRFPFVAQIIPEVSEIKGQGEILDLLRLDLLGRVGIRAVLRRQRRRQVLFPHKLEGVGGSVHDHLIGLQSAVVADSQIRHDPEAFGRFSHQILIVALPLHLELVGVRPLPGGQGQLFPVNVQGVIPVDIHPVALDGVQGAGVFARRRRCRGLRSGFGRGNGGRGFLFRGASAQKDQHCQQHGRFDLPSHVIASLKAIIRKRSAPVKPGGKHVATGSSLCYNAEKEVPQCPFKSCGMISPE